MRDSERAPPCHEGEPLVTSFSDRSQTRSTFPCSCNARGASRFWRADGRAPNKTPGVEDKVSCPTLRSFYSYPNQTYPTDHPMNSRDPFQRLRDLDRTSPQFHKQLTNFFCGSVYQDALPYLRSKDLAWLVEYLNNVRLQVFFLHAALNSGIDSRRYFRSCNARVPGIPAPTQGGVWRKGSATEILHTFRASPGMRVRRNLQRFESAGQTHQDVPRSESTEGQGGM